MPTVVPAYSPAWTFRDNNGNPLSGGFLYSYVAGTSTQQATYTDSTGSTPNTNPIVLNARGECFVWVPPNTAYKYILTDSAGNQIWSDDNVVVQGGNTGSLIPVVDNTYTLGNSSFSWANVYVGANHAPIWNSTAGIVGYYAQTPAEQSASVTPTNYAYPPGDVRRYGAVGDGSTDCTTAFSNALLANSGLTVYVPPPATAYKITSTLTVPANTTIQGYNKYKCKILVGANVDAFILKDGAALYELYIEGNATTGRGIVINTGDGNQTVQNCRVINFDCGTTQGVVHFTATDAGSRSTWHDIECWQTNGGTGNGKYAFLIQDAVQLAANPRKFSAIETAGKCAFSFGGADDLFICNSFLADLAYSANTRSVHIVSTRIANQSTMTVDGHNNSLVACDIFPAITINSGADNLSIGPGSFNSLPITDNSGNGRNNISHAGLAYTPTWSSGGTQPVLGNGTLTGYYSRSGTMLSAVINLTLGSTSTVGTGDLRFSLPVARANGDIPEVGSLVINRGGTLYTAVAQIPGNVGYVTFIRDTSGSVTGASPGALTTGDTLRCEITYML